MKEWREELEMTSEIPAKAKAKYTVTTTDDDNDKDDKNNPSKPNVDNKMSGKKNMQK